ncbi:nucleoside ABC transporter membrane protein [Motilibacter rhizosphaerae]|uniref:Nucleoside ABC transporter membrane protein n=1 Tax=Motilibacter rhizosphaerae TaxID=598652 RepID=A0A4V2F4R8_9ACTN|nr:ABC transporter permease [Motilibacter rhizosphaerae]RZS90269.1 nucleoside ABC transporter membrane protein [Motilibacter rhizosphaerae]
MRRERVDRLLLGLAAAVLAFVFAAVITSVVLVVSGHNPLHVLEQMASYGTSANSEATIVNNATTYYLSAIAVAIGFRMNLFNIGVDGQYRLAAILSAAVGGSWALPTGLRQAAVILTAALVGALWAGIAGLLKVTRGVSEVISTIMLNYIATGVVAYLLTPKLLAVTSAGSNNIGTKPIPPSGQVGGFSLIPGADTQVYGLVLLAVAVGVGFHVLVNRTRFGFDLRATGRSSSAALASGVDVRRMVLTSMVLSGAVAGLVGMPNLLGESHTYSLDFPSGLGFTGIAIALLGRNNPVGIAFGALLWAFLDQSALILDINGVPKEIVQITQGTVVLSVVVAYELVRRLDLVRQQRRVAAQLSSRPGVPAEVAA